MDTAPSETLYINNINEKVKKNVLKKMLYMLFSQYGKIIDIVACKGLKRRGQVSGYLMKHLYLLLIIRTLFLGLGRIPRYNFSYKCIEREAGIQLLR